jgi:hypothetical protein
VVTAPEVQAEADRIASVLLRVAREIGELAADAPATERFRWRRAQQVLATGAAEVGLPGLFSPERVNEDVQR